MKRSLFIDSLDSRRICLSPLAILIFSIWLSACFSKPPRNMESREDALALKNSFAAQDKIPHSLMADVETKPVTTQSIDMDAADDPAIWYNEVNPSRSIIFGSNKTAGIHSYDLQGNELQFIKCGRINNIDVRSNVDFGGLTFDILAGSNRSSKSIVVFLIDEDGKIDEYPDYEIKLTSFEPYGFCLYNNGKSLFAFVNNKEGDIYQFFIGVDNKGDFYSRLVRKLKLETQVEGMVADDTNDKLYVGEEEAGIYVFDADSNASRKASFIQASAQSNPMISFDIEGLALLPPHYLIASSQGNFSYAIFNTVSNDFITSFKIEDGVIDGVEETDGIEIIAKKLSPEYPAGIFVAQDGFNKIKSTDQAQNYKVVNLQKILDLLKD